MKRIIYALLTLVMAVACTSQGHYKITVTFPDASCDGDTMYLTNYDSGDTVAQTLVANACATIEGEVDTSFMARMLVHGQRMGFVVEKGDIAIIWQDGRATGTNLNEVLNDLDKRLEEIGDNDSLAVEAFKTTYHENVENAIGPWALNYYLMYNEFSATQIDSILSALPARYRNLRRVQKAIAFAQQHELTAPGKKYTDFSNEAGERLSDHLATDKVNIVDFWASWCGPCKMLAPILEEVGREKEGSLKIAKINVDDEPELANQFGINSIPSVFLFKNGEVANRAVGLMPKAKVLEFIG